MRQGGDVRQFWVVFWSENCRIGIYLLLANFGAWGLLFYSKFWQWALDERTTG